MLLLLPHCPDLWLGRTFGGHMKCHLALRGSQHRVDRVLFDNKKPVTLV